MWRTMLFLLAAFLCFSTVNGSSLRIPDYCKCYNSSDLAAPNASLLYDDHLHTGDLWNRDDLQKPLPPCSDIIDALSNGTCEVCRGEQVFVVCRNLSESVAMRMEGSSKGIEISRCGGQTAGPDLIVPAADGSSSNNGSLSTACDQLASKAEVPTTAGSEIWSVLAAVLIFITLAAAAFILINHFKKSDQKMNKTQKLLS